MDYGEFDDDFDFTDDNGAWPTNEKSIRPLMPPKRGFGGPHNNDRYNNAYGNYRGGYGPGGGFGPPPGPPGPPMGPPMGPPLGPRGPGMRGPGPRGPGLMGPGPIGPPGPGPMIMFGRGFDPSGGPPGPMHRNISPENRAFRYLLRCGVAKESIKNIPKEMLQLMEPQHCGVCGLDFDSFIMSRMHYTSRNHSKNMKKWISQNSEYSKNTKEIPLKARELYCELCDVHITSTTHAESHYAGKPHRAIVEGRKKPKNPFLLQKGMEARADQLIRREKKHLSVQPKKVEVASTELKAPPADLYCDICKTSVTCSEQMTMHLNGKKHLSREKQHIIRVMNGSADVVAVTEQVEAPADVNMDGNGSGDWGDGSGTWEEN